MFKLAEGLPEGLSSHRALYDALVTARLFVRLANTADGCPLSLEELRGQLSKGGDDVGCLDGLAFARLAYEHTSSYRKDWYVIGDTQRSALIGGRHSCSNTFFDGSDEDAECGELGEIATWPRLVGGVRNGRISDEIVGIV